MARVSIPLVAGRGIDRASGALAADQASWHRIVNAWLREGKLVARGGLLAIGTEPGDVPPPPTVSFQTAFQDTFVDADTTLLEDHVPTPDGLETWEIPTPLSQYAINAFNMAAETVYDGSLNLFPARATYVTPAAPSKFRVWGDFYRTATDFLGFGSALWCYINAGAQTETGGSPMPPQLYNSLALSMRRSTANQFDTEVMFYDGTGVAASLSAPSAIVQAASTGLRYILEVDEVGGTIAFYTADYLTGDNEVLIEDAIALPPALLAKAAINKHVGFMTSLATSSAHWCDGFAVEVEVTTIPSGPFVPYTDIIGIFPFRANRGGVMVTYDRATRQLAIWTIDGSGAEPVNVGTWATLTVGAPLPLCSAAEAQGKMFFAHSEQLFNYRAKTIYFDPTLSPGSQLVDYTADLDRTAPAQIFYRTVKTWLGAIWGTGFGTASDQNRPEMVRNSDQGDVLVVRPESYFLAGSKDDAIIGLMLEGGVLKPLKGAEKYRINGEDPSTFGITLEETTYGLAGDRLVLELGQEAIVWSEQGPRLHAGGPSIDIGLALELDGLALEGVVAPGAEAYGWMVYSPDERAVIIGFPDLDTGTKTFCYVLSRRDPTAFKWSFFELQQCVYSAGLLVAGAPNVGTIPTAFATNPVIVDSGAVGTGRQAGLTFDTNALIGGETWQVFAKGTGGVWAVIFSFAASGGASEAVTIPGFEALQHYEIAIRAIKAGNATQGFTDASPDAWTSVDAPGSKTTFDTSCAAPVIASIGWARTSATDHHITVNVTLAALSVGFELERSASGVGGWTLAESYAAPHDGRALVHVMADVDLATKIYWRIRAKRLALVSADSAVVSRWIGPLIVPDFFAAQSTVTQDFDMYVRTSEGTGKLQVQTSPDGATAWVTQFFSATFAAPQNIPSSIALASVTFIRARYAVTSFTIDDFGDWSATDSFKLTNGAAPAAPSVFTSVDYISPTNIDVHFASLNPDFELILYLNTVDPGSFKFKSGALATSTVINLSDLYHIPSPLDPSYDLFAGGGSDPIGIVSFALHTVGGLRKISAATAESIPLVIAGAPTNLVLSQPGGVGTLHVAWDNNLAAPAQTSIRWGVGPAGGMAFLTPDEAVAGPSDAVDGPTGGLTPLPASGVTIKVRVYGFKGIGSPQGRTDVTEQTIMLI